MSPRWYSILNGALAAEKNPTYTLSTVLATPSGPAPRSRSVIHRALVAPTPARPLLLTTTDIRTPKAAQLHANASCEATFWFAAAQVQFRVVARAYMLPAREHAWHAAFPARELAGGGGDWDWDGERVRVFDGVSGHLRASFLRPVPGTVMESYAEGEEWPVTVPRTGEAGDEQRELVDGALANFALVVLDPTEVEFLELGPIPNRRTRWRKTGEQWEEHIVVP